MKKEIVLLLLLVAVMAGYLVYTPAPTPLSAQEKAALDAEMARKTEWSIYGDTVTRKVPIIEIPKEDPIFRVVMVSISGKSGGYHFKEDYLTTDFGHPRSIDLGEIVRKYHRKKLEKEV